MAETKKEEIVRDCHFCGNSGFPVPGTTMVSIQLYERLKQGAEAHGLDLDGLLKWADRCILEASMVESIRLGDLEVVGIDECRGSPSSPDPTRSRFS